MPLLKSYRLARLAKADIADIYKYTKKTWSASQAETYYAMIVAAFVGLVSGTKTGRTSAFEDYSSLRVGSHIIFYYLDDSTVHIDRVLHQAMDVERHLKR